MADSRFFSRQAPLTLGKIISLTGVERATGCAAEASQSFQDVASLEAAGVEDVSFFDNSKYLQAFCESKAGACFVKPKYVEKAPEGMICLITADPYRAYAKLAQEFYPVTFSKAGISAQANVDTSAEIHPSAQVDAGVTIRAHVSIGAGSVIRSGAVIDVGCVIGDHCHIGENAVISHSLIGSNTIIHRGCAIGQDGFGYAPSAQGHLKVPQLGRVIIEDGVEIGANSCIDRGAGPDTIIRSGAKIDNLVQIAHNVEIGRGAIIVAQAGIAGSSHIGAGVMVGGQVGIAGHLTIGAGAQLAAQSGVMTNVEAGQVMGGAPAMPIKDWHRATLAIKKLIKPRINNGLQDS